jgi:hypothetical protein
VIPFLLLNLSGSIVQSNQTHLILNTAKDSSFDVFQWVSFVLGVASAIISALIIKYIEIRLMKPDIKIMDTVVVTGFHLTDNGQQVFYHANRIRVENKGRTAAQNCKAYLELNDTHIERTGWMLPDMNAGYTVTLNVKDKEYVDLCAIDVNGTNRVATLEYGYTKGTVDSCVPLGNQIIEATIKITSSNASVSRRKIRIHNVPNHFRGEPNRIVEFLDCPND